MSKQYRIVWKNHKGVLIISMTGTNLTELIETSNDELRRLREEENNSQPLNLVRTIYRTDPRHPKVSAGIQKEDEKIAING